MDKKKMWIVLAAAGGAAALGVGAYALWNSKQLRMVRTAKRAGKILYKTGAMLQTMSGVVGE